MADYGPEYEKIRAAGADLIAISVDTIAQASAMKRDLKLPFHILCDTDRKTITAWGLVNHREREIAIPAAFIVDRDMRLRFAATEGSFTRVEPAAVTKALAELAAGRAISAMGTSRTVRPGAMFLRAAMNALARGFKSR